MLLLHCRSWVFFRGSLSFRVLELSEGAEDHKLTLWRRFQNSFQAPVLGSVTRLKTHIRLDYEQRETFHLSLSVTQVGFAYLASPSPASNSEHPQPPSMCNTSLQSP